MGETKSDGECYGMFFELACDRLLWSNMPWFAWGLLEKDMLLLRTHLQILQFQYDRDSGTGLEIHGTNMKRPAGLQD